MGGRNADGVSGLSSFLKAEVEHMQRGSLPSSSAGQLDARDFGMFLKMLRHRHHLQQLHVLAHLPGWTQATYSRVESGHLAPAFDQLVSIYSALRNAGAEVTPQDRQQFLTLARLRIEGKKTCRENKTDQEWDVLRLQLSQGEPVPRNSTTERPTRGALAPHLLETRHLVGRHDWLVSVITSLSEPRSKKLVVLQGPPGIGKSSELHRIAQHFLNVEPHPHVVVCVFPTVEHQSAPIDALDYLLSTLLAEIGPPDDPVQMASVAVRSNFVLACLEKLGRPVLVLIDNAEHLLDEHGQCAPCWEQFLKKFLLGRHAAVLVLATKEWPGWHKGERVFVAERMIPLLTVEEGVVLLQNLGLAAVAEEHLRQASESVGGIPLCLEWVASLARKSLWLDSWDDLDDLSDEEESKTMEVLTRRLVRLLEDTALFGGDIASRLSPLLERILSYRLSAEAREVLHTLSLVNIPLGKAALQHLCSRPSLLKELRMVSLLTTHQQRVQVLPMVAAQVRSRLLPEQQRSIEEHLIDAYRHWLDNGEMSDKEIGTIIAELATLYMKCHRLLEAADLLIAYGWMSFNHGYGPRLARFAEKIMQQYDWNATPKNECGGLLLYHVLTAFLGNAVNSEKRAADYQHILVLNDESKVIPQATTKMELIRVSMWYHMNCRHFEEAQVILDAGMARLASDRQTDIDVRTSLPAFRAMLLAKWSDYLEEQGAVESVLSMYEEAIALFKQCCVTVANTNEASSLKSRLLKKRLSAYLNYLGYRLTRNGRPAEALEFLAQSIALGEKGYCNFGVLAAAYGDMSQALMELGRLEEALFFDEKAMTEVQRCADSGDVFSQDEVWVYYVNRGCLYLRLGRLDEAEALLREAESHLQPNRSVYRLFARKALKEIEQHCGQILSE